jgi:glycosyltransferase involved in cell wall biosynthesis
MTSVLIDASNLHVGGGIQVAASFLDELATLTRVQDSNVTWPSELRVEASPEVMADLASDTVQTLNPIPRDRHPTQWRSWIPRKPHFDVSFVVFGPEYGYPRAVRRVVGFADATAVLPRPPTLEGGPAITSAKKVLRARVSRTLLARASILITETEVLANALRESLPRTPDIEVVPNAINSVFSTPARWKPVPRLTARDSDYTICYVARAYDHKNHRVLPEVAGLLQQKFGLNVDFVVTLKDDEWDGLASRDSQVNVGPLTIDQVPTLLDACDASILPSLMETFSVTPLEAFAMRRPLFASDCDFIRDSCANAPIYFNPRSPTDIANTLAQTLTNPDLMAKHVERGSQLLTDHISPRERTIRYMQILQKSTKGIDL